MRRTVVQTVFVAAVFLHVAGPVSYAKVIYVDDDGPVDFATIQAAIDAASDGDTVLVAPGTYTGEGNRDIDFLGKAITVARKMLTVMWGMWKNQQPFDASLC